MGKYGGFGGKLLEGETLPQAAIRELYEEAGIIVVPGALASYGTLNFIFPFRQEYDQEVHIFIAQDWSGTPVESEEMRPMWFPLENLPMQKMWDDTRFWMPHILQLRSIRATFILNNDNETVKEYIIQLL